MSWENGQDRRGRRERRPETDIQPRFSPHHDLSPTSALSFGKKFSHQLNSTEQVHRPSRTHSPYPPRARPRPAMSALTRRRKQYHLQFEAKFPSVNVTVETARRRDAPQPQAALLGQARAGPAPTPAHLSIVFSCHHSSPEKRPQPRPTSKAF